MNAGPSRRQYSSPRRQAQADATRRALLDAAERLFTTHGYAATSIRQIATEAGVVPQTVYDVFGDKPSVLRALGDRQALDRQDGSLAEAMTATRTPAERARVAVRAAIEAAQAGDFRKVVNDAVSADSRLVDLEDWADEQSYADARRITVMVVGTSADEPTITAIADRAWATLSTQAIRRLLLRRGWSPARVEDWAVEIILGYLVASGIDVEESVR